MKELVRWEGERGEEKGEEDRGMLLQHMVECWTSQVYPEEVVSRMEKYRVEQSDLHKKIETDKAAMAASSSPMFSTGGAEMKTSFGGLHAAAPPNFSPMKSIMSLRVLHFPTSTNEKYGTYVRIDDVKDGAEFSIEFWYKGEGGGSRGCIVSQTTIFSSSIG